MWALGWLGWSDRAAPAPARPAPPTEDPAKAAAEAELTSLDWLVERIREVGLVPIPDAALTYEGEEDYINGSQQGLIQIPREFARWLLLLGEVRPRSYLEIGCFNGASTCLAAAAAFRAIAVCISGSSGRCGATGASGPS